MPTISYTKYLCQSVIYTVFLFMINGCNNRHENKQDTNSKYSPPKADTVAVLTSNLADTSDYQTLYITIADTGTDYYKQRTLMSEISSALHIPIDTMNRYYNAEKDEIVVAEDDEDEMYRGEYAPRRFPSQYLSLDYMFVYCRNTGKKNIAVVAGIFESKKSADSLQSVLLVHAPKCFVATGNVFVGCMH